MQASDLAHFIDYHAIAAEIVILPQETPTVEAAAQAVGVAPDQIIKSVLFMLKRDRDVLEPILVIANGLSRIAYKKVAAFLGVSRRRLRMARPEEVAAITGYAVGTVPPFGHKEELRTLLDRNVLLQKEIYGGGGAMCALMRLTTDELQRVLGAALVDVTE